MTRRFVIFKAAGRTVRFAVATGKRVGQRGKAKYTHYTVRQRSLKHKVDRSVPKGASSPMFRAHKGKCFACATCGRRYINYKAATNHVKRANHSYIATVRV